MTAACLAGSTALPAQQVDSVRGGVSAPPISPGRAFLFSALLPGAGQAKLDRAYAGGLFFLIEAVGLTFIQRTTEDLRIARALASDSLPLRYVVDPITGRPARTTDGRPQVAAWQRPIADEGLVRARRLHREDWIALVVFNHLFAAADAFVAAQLWDLPVRVGVVPTGPGARISATLTRR